MGRSKTNEDFEALFEAHYRPENDRNTLIDQATRNSRSLTQIVDVRASARTAPGSFIPVPDKEDNLPVFGAVAKRRSPEKKSKIQSKLEQAAARNLNISSVIETTEQLEETKELDVAS